MELTLGDGRKATVRFHSDSRGGTLELRDAQDAALYEGQLGAGVDTFPTFAQ